MKYFHYFIVAYIKFYFNQWLKFTYRCVKPNILSDCEYRCNTNPQNTTSFCRPASSFRANSIWKCPWSRSEFSVLVFPLISWTAQNRWRCTSCIRDSTSDSRFWCRNDRYSTSAVFWDLAWWAIRTSWNRFDWWACCSRTPYRSWPYFPALWCHSRTHWLVWVRS